ncbi:MAG TPA: hypothetical protein VFS92_04340, partial [Planctomycetota bacterium]|nr:hypothetical protein [Planctomycetota bacterium]
MPAAVRRATLAALVLVASACAATESREEPPAAGENPAATAELTRSQSAPEPASAPFTADEEFTALRAAHDAGRHEEVLSRVDACFRGPEDWNRRWWAAAMAARAAYKLEEWERSAHFSRLCSELRGKLPPGEASEEWIRGVTLIGASALIALDRFPEAEFKLDVAAEHFPDYRENAEWKGLRRLARRPPPLEFVIPL